MRQAAPIPAVARGRPSAHTQALEMARGPAGSAPRRASRPSQVKHPAPTYSLGVSQYHRPSLLNDCVRNGNRCSQTGIGTGMNFSGSAVASESQVPKHMSLERRSRWPSTATAGWTANKCSQVNRPISTGELSASLRLHRRPINLVVYQGPDGETSSRSGFRAYMPSALILSGHSYPAVPRAR